MAKARVSLRRVGMRDLLNDPGVESALTSRMERTLSAAKADAPVRTGAYQESLHLETVHTDRVVVRVVSDVEHAYVVEAATGNLSRSLDAAGGA